MKPLGRIIVLILMMGLAVGAYRWWQARSGSATAGGGFAFKMPSFGASTGSSDRGESASGNVEVLTTATKQGWLQEEITAFNSAHAGQPPVTLKLLESREAMHAILGGKEQPAVWSPSSPVWIARLRDVWPSQHNGQAIIDMGDPGVYRTYLKSPLVFVTTRQKAAFLRPLLTGPHPWAEVRALSSGQKRTPWGSFKWAHADPLNASSGMLTMSLILTEYAQEHGQSGSLEQAAASPGFASYLQQVERRFVYDPNALGSTALEKAFVADPASRDFITAYESKALEAVAENPDLTVLYPNPTANADQSAAALSAPWLSDAQKTQAQAFVKFLDSEQALRDAMTYHFRPAQSGGSLSLASQLSDNAGHGFQQTYSAIELPPYDALNEAASQWRVYVAHQTGR